MGDERAAGAGDGQAGIVPRGPDFLPGAFLRPQTHHQRSSSVLCPAWRAYGAQRHVCAASVDRNRACIWLATWGGVIAWYPGQDVAVRYTSDHGLVGNATRAIVVDEAGVVWAAGREGGLAYLLPEDDEIWRPYQDAVVWQTPLAWTVSAMAARPGGGVYVALRMSHHPSGVGSLDAPGNDLHWLIRDGLAVRDVSVLVSGDHNNLWIGNAWGAHVYRDGAVTSDALDGRRVTALALAWDGDVWAGTDRGLYRLRTGQPAGVSYQRVADDLSSMILSLDFDLETGDLWAATPYGVGRVYGGAWQPVRNPPPGQPACVLTPGTDGAGGLPPALVLAEDHVWVGASTGLYRVGMGRHRALLAPSPEDGLSNSVQAICVAASGVWAGAARGLARFDEDRWRGYDVDALPVEDVRALLPGTGDTLWLGSGASGLYRLAGDFYLGDHPLDEPVIALGGDGDRVWAATDRGVLRLDDDGVTWVRLSYLDEALAGCVIRALCYCPPDAAGHPARLWVGTSDGLFVYDPALNLGDWVGGDLVNAPVYALAQATLDGLSAGEVWAATASGLYALPSGRQLYAGAVTALAFDPAPGSRVWLGTASGLIEGLMDDMEDGIVVKPGKVWTSANGGLASNVVTALAVHGLDGRFVVWIGTATGISRFET